MGTFLRAFSFGHVRQLDAVAARTLQRQAAVSPRLLTGTESMAFVDSDDTIREVHGYQKQSAAHGYCGRNSQDLWIGVSRDLLITS